MDIFQEFRLAVKNPFSIKSFYVIFINLFFFLLIGVILAVFVGNF